MALLTQAAPILASRLIGDGSFAAYDNATAFLGVGDSATAFNASQTGLIGANKTYKAMDATYPSRSGAVVTIRSTFQTGDANYAWNEWVWCLSNAGANCLSRAVTSLGTKTSSSVWQLTATVTFGVA